MRIALYQGAPRPLDVPGNLERLQQQAQLAAAGGAQLLVCPEMFLTGYNIGLGAVQRLAEPNDGPSAMSVVDIAQAHRIAIAYGYRQLPAGLDAAAERRMLDGILAEAAAAGQVFLGNEDSAPLESAHPGANYWTAGTDPAARPAHWSSSSTAPSPATSSGAAGRSSPSPTTPTT